MSKLEETLLLQMRAVGLPEPVRELRFAAEHVGKGPGLRERLKAAGLKDWRFDFCWPDLMFAVEVSENYDILYGDRLVAADALGWSVYWLSHSTVRGGNSADTIGRLLLGKRMGKREAVC